MKWLRYLIAVSGVVFITQLTTTANAYATSDYDSLIQVTSDLKVTYDGHSDLDVSNNYMGYFKNAIIDDVAQYQCNSPSSSGTDSTWCDQVIDDSLDHGDWLISVQDNASPIYSVSHKDVMGQFCDQKITSITGMTNSYPSYTGRYLMGSSTAPANCVAVHLGYQNYTNGTHLVVSAQGWANLTTNAIELNGDLTTGSGTINQGYQYLFTSTASYPDGYKGDYIPSEYTPPVPTTTLYTGTIDCGGEMPVAMSIYQPGNNGAATLVQQSLGIAQWSYSLTSDPYSFTVDCGDGKLATPYESVSPAPPTSNKWICDIYSTEPYHCALS